MFYKRHLIVVRENFVSENFIFDDEHRTVLITVTLMCGDMRYLF